MKKKLSFLLAFVMILSAMSFAFADMPETEECCGEEHVHELAALGNGDGGIVPMYSGGCTEPGCDGTSFTYTVKNDSVHRVHCRECGAYFADENHLLSGGCVKSCVHCVYTTGSHYWPSSWTYQNFSVHRKSCMVAACSAYTTASHSWRNITATSSTQSSHTGRATCDCGTFTFTFPCPNPSTTHDATSCFKINF